MAVGTKPIPDQRPATADGDDDDRTPPPSETAAVAGTATAVAVTATAVAGKASGLVLYEIVGACFAHEQSTADADKRSIAGDTVCSDMVEAPLPRNASSKFNSNWEVGNFGLFFGNWGKRGTAPTDAEGRNTRETSDRQILRNPGQVVILAEATEAIAQLLREPPVAVEPGVKGLRGRSTFTHFVTRCDEAPKE